MNMKKNNHLDIKPDEKVCYNCEHKIWLVALGQGVRCGYNLNKNDIQNLPMIPHLRHSCDNFNFKNSVNEE